LTRAQIGTRYVHVVVRLLHWTISATGSSVRQPEVAVLRLCWALAEDLLDMETGAATTFAGYKTLRDSRQGDPVTAMWSQE